MCDRVFMVVYGAKRVQNQNFSSQLTLYYVWRVELFCAPQSAFDISPPSPPHHLVSQQLFSHFNTLKFSLYTFHRTPKNTINETVKDRIVTNLHHVRRTRDDQRQQWPARKQPLCDPCRPTSCSPPLVIALPVCRRLSLQRRQVPDH